MQYLWSRSYIAQDEKLLYMADPTIWALVVGVIGLILTIGIAAWRLGGKLSELGNTLSTISDGVNSLDEDLSEVKNELSDIRGNTDDLYNGIVRVMDEQGIDFIDLVSKSIKYNLEESDVEAVISFGSVDKEENITELTIRFDEGIMSRSMLDNLIESEELANFERELFGDNQVEEGIGPGQPMFSKRGGGQVLEAIIPSTDDSAISKWLSRILDYIDAKYAEQTVEREEFEKELLEELDGSYKV